MKAASRIVAWLLLLGMIAQRFGVPLPFADPPPIDEPGARVVVIEQTEDRAKLTPDQVATLGWLGSYLPKHIDAGNWRVLDADTVLDSEGEWLRNAVKRERTSTPWAIFSRCKGGNFEGPLPDRATIQRYVEGES